MSRLAKEDYKRTVEILKRYNYNCINILNIRADIMSISIPEHSGMPKASNHMVDPVYHKYIQLEEDKELQKSLKEYKIVINTMELLNEECKRICHQYFILQQSKWDIMEKLGLSERTFLRRKKEIIYTADRERKKMA